MRLFIILLATAALSSGEAVYITVFRDPCRAAEVHRLAPSVQASAPVTVIAPDGSQREIPSVAVSLKGTEWSVQRALVDGLQPATEYRLRFAGGGEDRWRTVPATLDRPLRVASGGDTMHRPEWLAATARALAARDPDLVVLGGDLAYEDGKDGKRVLTWIRTWAEAARAPDGRVLPFISCIGNHEVDGHYGGSPASAPFFFAMLPLEGHAYHAVDIGSEISFVLLDTDHATRIPGAQTEWLAAALAERSQRPTVIPVFHYPAYPTVKIPSGSNTPLDERVAVLVRQHWVPLFERAGVRVVLEHDQHTYKRTVPLKAGAPAEDGIVYLGDGAWGVEVRALAPGLPWLAKGAAVRHGYLHEISAGGSIAVSAINETGQVFDQTVIPARPR
jgi:hypothetical protein